MPLSPEHKERSKQRILDSAVKLFTHNGFDNTSIDKVMNDAKMTRGAFYAHFSSKSDLYKEAILTAASKSSLIKKKPDNIKNQEWVSVLINEYLSMEHVDLKQPPCALAFLVTDIAIRELDVRNTYTDIFKDMNNMIHNLTKSYSFCSKRRVLAATSMLIGGIAVARALNDSKTVIDLLEACKTAAHEILET